MAMRSQILWGWLVYVFVQAEPNEEAIRLKKRGHELCMNFMQYRHGCSRGFVCWLLQQ